MDSPNPSNAAQTVTADAKIFIIKALRNVSRSAEQRTMPWSQVADSKFIGSDRHDGRDESYGERKLRPSTEAGPTSTRAARRNRSRAVLLSPRTRMIHGPRESAIGCRTPTRSASKVKSLPRTRLRFGFISDHESSGLLLRVLRERATVLSGNPVAWLSTHAGGGSVCPTENATKSTPDPHARLLFDRCRIPYNRLWTRDLSGDGETGWLNRFADIF